LDSKQSLEEFASSREVKVGAWVDTLPDDVFNQAWDALSKAGGIGKVTVTHWLQSIGYVDATQGKVSAILTRERR
tara:strand:+ start:801 stop:1025 length:225 start_codon:yes stop_codon:yes gene_type:complete